MKTTSHQLTFGVLSACLILMGVARAQTVLWSETFADGNGNNRWYADAGVWQIGSPTIGPETNSVGYHTYPPISTNCATTGLTANYPSGMNSRLIRIQTFTVPAAIQFPRLRFWHWYNFNTYGGNDYGVVEIRIGTSGTWQAVSPHYTGFSGDWTYASVDLSAFAGQTVQLAFHAVYASVATAPGWYVDGISVISGTPVLNNPEGFESGITNGWYAQQGGDWYAEQGVWQVGSPKKSGGAPTNSLGAQAYAGANCAATLLNANYPAGMNSRFISPYFILPPPSMSPFLRFWHWYNFNTYGGSDYGVVQIQVGTNAWQSVSPDYTGSSGGWTEPFIDLTSYGGQTVRLAFQAVYASVATGQGWYVDNVQVYPYTLSALNPYLNINLDATGTNTIVDWTSLPEYTGFTLESTNNIHIPPANWNAVFPAPVVVNGINTVTNHISGKAMFYQLSQ